MSYDLDAIGVRTPGVSDAHVEPRGERPGDGSPPASNHTPTPQRESTRAAEAGLQPAFAAAGEPLTLADVRKVYDP